MHDVRPAATSRPVWSYATVLAVAALLVSGLCWARSPLSVSVPVAAAARAERSAARTPGSTLTPAGDSLAVSAAAGGPEQSAAARTPRRGMSMDAPIQGGLTAHEAQAVSAQVRQLHQEAALAPASRYWTPAMGLSAVARARSWLGLPYSWAAGDRSGPTPGRCQAGDGGDLDCHIIGFDCSGLTMYAWGAYGSLSHLAETQVHAGLFRPTLRQLLPGDLVFFSGYLPGGIGHVAIYAGHGTVIEAPQSGSVIQESPLATLMAEDGTYRGAVRPLTGKTPVLLAPRTPLSTKGGTLVLRGTELGAVDAVQVGGVTSHSFLRHTNTMIALRVPAHRAGRLAVTVSTTWLARSRPVPLVVAVPRRVPHVTRSGAARTPSVPVSTSDAPLPSWPAPSSSTTVPVSTTPPVAPPTTSAVPTASAPPGATASSPSSN